MNDSPLLVPLIVVLFLIFFVALWTFVLFILSHVSGWQRLAGRFHRERPFRGKTQRYRSARMNLVNFSAMLEIGGNEEGFYLRPMLIFRPFFKSLLIPWSEIEAEPFDWVIYRGHQLTFRSFPRIKLKILGRTFEEIRGNSNLPA
jgi:hypothetical protein